MGFTVLSCGHGHGNVLHCHVGTQCPILSSRGGFRYWILLHRIIHTTHLGISLPPTPKKKTMVEKRGRQHKTPPLESEWEGGPSQALKRTLLESSYAQSQSQSSHTMPTNVYQPRHRHRHRHRHHHSSSNSTTTTRSKRERERRNTNTHRIHRRRKKKNYLFDKIGAWCLLLVGSIFALIGSYFSIRDIYH